MNKDQFYGLLETIKAGKDAEKSFFSLIYDKAKKAYLVIVSGGYQRASFDDFSINENGGFQLIFRLPGGEPDIISFASVDEFFELDIEKALAEKQRKAEEDARRQQQDKEEEEKAMLAKLKAKYEPEVAQ